MEEKKNPKLLFRHGECKNDDYELDMTPEVAGWTYSGLKILNLNPGDIKTLLFDTYELCILPLAGLNTVVRVNSQEYTLKGRESVFTSTSDFLYIPLNSQFEIESQTGARLALPMAKCTKQFEVQYVSADEIKVEIRGSGQATRQINNFCSPSTFLKADKLCSVEVFTPSGNWSSYPPHKHDTQSSNEAELEEIYYFLTDDPKGFAFHRTYTKDANIDATETVRDGDIFLVPKGYHGPTATAPGYNLYYLNVLAGPGEIRTMQFCDDPDYQWVRAEWRKDCTKQDDRFPVCKGGILEK